MCLDTCYADYVHPICQQAFQQGFEGQIISCTADFYDQVIAKTSEEFMEGSCFSSLTSTIRRSTSRINFTGRTNSTPSTTSASEGQWSAVRWEYSAIMKLW